VRRLALTALLASLAAAPAAAFVEPVTVRGDLDGDRPLERVEAVRVDLPDVEDPFDRTAIRVTDSCRGRLVARRVAGPQDNLATLRLRPVDPRPGREILADLRSGASGRLGEARVVAWRRGGPDCRRPRSLLRYLSDRPTRSPRGATDEVSFFSVRLREASRRYAGTEIVLTERFLRRGDPACCGSIRKTTLLRYSRARDRYVTYRATVGR
jgi:hypothetical protein